MENIKDLDFNKALQALEKVSESFTVDAWIPSMQREVKFKQIDAKQQKDILSSAMDTSVYNTSFIKTFYDILKENVLEKDIDVNDLTLIDKISVGLALKSELSDDIVLFFGEKKEISEKFKIQPIINKLKQFKLPNPINLDTKSENFSLKVEISPVTVGIENDYDSQYKGNKKQEDIKTTEDVQKIISEAFLGELSKYITKLWINETEIDYKSLSYNQKMRVIEKLPSSFLQKIIDSVSVWKLNVDEFLSVNYEQYTQTILLEPTMFLS
jgi:hypothetical protein